MVAGGVNVIGGKVTVIGGNVIGGIVIGGPVIGGVGGFVGGGL